MVDFLRFKKAFFREMRAWEKVIYDPEIVTEAEAERQLDFGHSIVAKYRNLGIPAQFLNFWCEELADYPIISLRNRLVEESES